MRNNTCQDDTALTTETERYQRDELIEEKFDASSLTVKQFVMNGANRSQPRAVRSRQLSTQG